MIRYAIVDENDQVTGEVDKPSPLTDDDFANMKKLANGKAPLRLLTVESASTEWWQAVTGHSDVVSDDGVTRKPVIEARTLDYIKRKRKNEVDDLLALKGAEGKAVNGQKIQLRPQDQPNVTAMALRAMLAISGAVQWDAGFKWRMADNTFYAVPTPQAMVALAELAAKAVVDTLKVAWAHKDAIEAMSDAGDVLAYDITANW